MRRDAHGRNDPMGVPLFSASHVDQWEALSSSPALYPDSLSSLSVNDHEWHWHPSKWPLLRRTPSGNSTPGNNDHASYSTAIRPKTLLLSSDWLGKSQPRAGSRQAWSESIAAVENHVGETSNPEDRRFRSEEKRQKFEFELAGKPSNVDEDNRYCCCAGNVDSRGVVACQYCWSNAGANGNTAVSILLSDRRADKTHRMAVKTHVWISLWFLLTAPVIFWDVFYCFMRPRSMAGGDLHWIWEPYGLYQEVDLVYGVESLQRNDGFPNAQSFMNVIETLLNLTYVYLVHVSGAPVAPLIGIATATMTLSKTVLYLSQEFYCGWCATGHNDFKTLLVFWILPNVLWIVFPSLIVYTLGKDIAATLGAAERRAIKATLGKKN